MDNVLSHMDKPPPTFESVYRAELRYVWNSLRRLGVAERSIEDFAHDVFLVVHRQLHTFDATRPIKPWLFGIAYRVAIGHHRRHGEQRELLDGREPTSTRSAHDPWPQHGVREEISRALDALDLDLRAVLILHDLDGATAGEIAHSMSLDENQVYSKIRAARRELKRALDAIRSEAS